MISEYSENVLSFRVSGFGTVDLSLNCIRNKPRIRPVSIPCALYFLLMDLSREYLLLDIAPRSDPRADNDVNIVSIAVQFADPKKPRFVRHRGRVRIFELLRTKLTCRQNLLRRAFLEIAKLGNQQSVSPVSFDFTRVSHDVPDRARADRDILNFRACVLKHTLRFYRRSLTR